MQYSCIISHWLSPLKRRFRDILIIIITNIVVLTSVVVTRVDYSKVPNQTICPLADLDLFCLQIQWNLDNSKSTGPNSFVWLIETLNNWGLKCIHIFQFKMILNYWEFWIIGVWIIEVQLYLEDTFSHVTAQILCSIIQKLRGINILWGGRSQNLFDTLLKRGLLYHKRIYSQQAEMGQLCPFIVYSFTASRVFTEK